MSKLSVDGALICSGEDIQRSNRHSELQACALHTLKGCIVPSRLQSITGVQDYPWPASLGYAQAP